jgi:hypothetical protein
MSRTAARFTQADINRAIRAARQAGAAAVLLLPDGTIRIDLGSPEKPPSFDGDDDDTVAIL